MDNPSPSGNAPDTIWSSGELISSLTSKSNLFIFAYSPKQKTLLAWSGNAEEILGVKDIAISKDGNLFLRHVHPDDRFLLMTDLENALKSSVDYRATYRWIRPDNNESRWLHCRGKLGQEKGEPIFEGVIIDLSPEFTGHVARMAGPDSLATILAAFPTMVFTVDRDLRILRLNRPPNMEAFNFGDHNFVVENFKIGRPLLASFSDPAQKQSMQLELALVLSGDKNYLRSRIATQESVYNLEISPLTDHGAIEGLLFVISDISEIVKLERELALLHKSEGLRLLASGVSHNFNNALQSIIGQAAAIRSHPENKQLVLESSQAIINVVNRASQLSQQLCVFEDSTTQSTTTVDVNLAAMAAAHKIEDLFSSGLKVAVAFGTPSPVIANQERLVDALVEILTNAREWTPEGGSINVRTYQVNLIDNEVQGLKTGSYAKIVISDSGSGMSDSVKDRCLDPFYTTKEKDPKSGVSLNGSGLGLSHSFAIAREYHGTITVETKPNFGTTVSVYLPIASDLKTDRKRNELYNIDPDFAPEILIIDDDLMVLQTAKQILESANYKCIVSEDPNHALTLVRRFAQPLRLVLIDAVMPGMDGASLLRKIKSINKHIVAIGFSGAPSEVTAKLEEAGVVQLLHKPVDPNVLKNAVQNALQSSVLQPVPMNG